jgi:hypothetical protein
MFINVNNITRVLPPLVAHVFRQNHLQNMHMLSRVVSRMAMYALYRQYIKLLSPSAREYSWQ